LAATIEEKRNMSSPLQAIKEQHGSKSALIDKIIPLVEALDGESADEHKARLAHVANAKLLHLLSVGEKVKALGGRKAIVAKILEIKKQPKDHEYEKALMALPLGQIVDLLASTQHRAAGKASKPLKRHRVRRG
jgi:hypothetical protein